MDLTEYVDTLRHDLLRAAAALGPESEQAAERLGFALDSAARLALMDALSDAAAEVTGELDGTSVEVRLRGREPVFVVAGSAPSLADTQQVRTDETTALSADDEGDGTSRITLRLPEALKARAEELAGTRGQSLNTWIVHAVRDALHPDSGPRAATWAGHGAPGPQATSSKRVQGWAR